MQKQILLLVLLGFCLQVQAQFVVKGKVTDDTGEALIGASIIEKGTTNGTVTDINGLFDLQTRDSLATLILAYTGFETQEIKLNSHKYLEVSLTEGISLQEVVVTGLGIKKEKKALGYSVTSHPSKQGRKKNKRTAKIRTQTPLTALQAPQSYTRQSSSKVPQYRRDQPEPSTEDYDVIQENRFYNVGSEPLSTFSIDVDAASYSNVRRFLNYNQRPPKDAVRIEEMINYFDYDYPTPSQNVPFEIVTEIAECPWESKHRLLHVGLQGQKIQTEQLPASNIVFLIDVSGSMNSSKKLPLLKSSFQLLVEQLRPQDRVAIVVYAGAAGEVLPSTSGAEKAKILAALNELKAGGSTAGGAGIKLAYQIARKNKIEHGNNRVIIATDGDFNVGASSDAEMVRLIEKERESGVFLSILGFGMENYKDNKMQKIADSGNGNHAYIDELAEAKKVLVDEFGGTLFTIAKDVKIQIEFNPKQVAGYRLIGYENRLLENKDFEDDTKDAGELGAGHTVTALYEIIPAGVKSDFLEKPAKLKYQKQLKETDAAQSGELASIALRYKSPKGTKSKLIERKVMNSQTPLAETSDNFRFSAAVAAFGLLLRDSDYKGTANFSDTKILAKNALGSDSSSYRAGFLKMIEKAQNLK